MTNGGGKRYNNPMTDNSVTIVAVSSPPGRGAIGIVRISGARSHGALKALFPAEKHDFEPGRMRHVTLDAGGLKDDCMAVFFRGPHSYTGEDSAEIYLHGSPALLRGVVDYLAEKEGLSYAEGGDFTARAVMNGKLDLTGAEGVLDMINAESGAQIRGAYSLISGKLRARIEELQRAVVRLRAETEAAIDYPEEDIEERSREEIAKGLDALISQAEELMSSYRGGRGRESGVTVALIGRPNVGKSSIMNALVGFDRAIVTEEAGTTRDAISESYVYRGIKFTVVDTAGLREAESLPEKMGVERARLAAAEADVVISVTAAGEDGEEYIPQGGQAVIAAENKVDLSPAKKGLPLCAITGQGIERLKEEILAASGAAEGEGKVALVNERQFAAVSAASQCLRRARESAFTRAIELVSSDLHEAYTELGKVTGVTGSDAVVAEIFSRFCVGK